MSTQVAERINDAAGRMATVVTRHSHLLPEAAGTALLIEVIGLFALADRVMAEAEQLAPGRPARWWQFGRRAAARARMVARVEQVAPRAPRLPAADEVLAASRSMRRIADDIGRLAWRMPTLPTSARARDRERLILRVDEVARAYGHPTTGAST